MKTNLNLNSINHTLLLGIVFLGLLSFSFIGANTHTPPTDTPPDGNAPAPINVGSAAQDKVGVLGVNGLSIFGQQIIDSTAPTLKLSDSDGRKMWLHNNNHNVYVLASRDGDGTNWEAPHPMIIHVEDDSVNDYVKFSQAVHADEYCNRAGTNCFTPGTAMVTSNISTYSHTGNPRGTTHSGKPVCSCNAGDFLTGCSGPQSGDYDTAAIPGTHACYGERSQPICTCLSVD